MEFSILAKITIIKTIRNENIFVSDDVYLFVLNMKPTKHSKKQKKGPTQSITLSI